MPLKLNAGLSRKVTDNNYGSRGASVNVELELDSGLISKPRKLKERIRQLFCLVRTSLAEELNGAANPQSQVKDHGQDQPPVNGVAKEPGNSQKAPRPATQSQLRAIAAIAKRLQINIDDVLRERFQVGQPQDLSVRQASELIDALNDSSQGGG